MPTYSCCAAFQDAYTRFWSVHCEHSTFKCISAFIPRSAHFINFFNFIFDLNQWALWVCVPSLCVGIVDFISCRNILMMRQWYDIPFAMYVVYGMVYCIWEHERAKPKTERDRKREKIIFSDSHSSSFEPLSRVTCMFNLFLRDVHRFVCLCIPRLLYLRLLHPLLDFYFGIGIRDYFFVPLLLSASCLFRLSRDFLVKQPNQKLKWKTFFSA